MGFRGFTWILWVHDHAKYQKPCKLCARNEPRKENAAEAFVLCQQNVKTMYFKTLNPRLFNLRQWFEVRFFSVVICKCCQFSMSLLGSYMWEFWMELKKNQIQGICWSTINDLTLCVYPFSGAIFLKLNKKRIEMNSVDLLYWNNLHSGPCKNVA